MIARTRLEPRLAEAAVQRLHDHDICVRMLRQTARSRAITSRAQVHAAPPVRERADLRAQKLTAAVMA
jgi:hypothetical protein